MSLIRWPRSGVTGEQSPSVHIEGHDNWDVVTDEDGLVKARCECGDFTVHALQPDAAEQILHHLKDQMKE